MNVYKFPSIPLLHNFVDEVLSTMEYHGVKELPVLRFKGVVKADGTNASIYKEYRGSDTSGMVCQSRERTLTIDDDNMGWAKFCGENPSVFDSLIEFVKKEMQVENKTIAVYGEWCGGSIKKKVAISKLPKMFILFGIAIKDLKNENDSQDNIKKQEIWVSPELVKRFFKENQGLNEQRIFNIWQFPSYEIELDFTDLEKAKNKLLELTEKVDKECPIGSYFGVEGVGEGIVWTCETNVPKIDVFGARFKTKGASHKIVNKKDPVSISIEKLNSIEEFVSYALTQARLEQGLDYLRENNKPLNMEGLGEYIKWCVNDCFKEEMPTLNKSGLTKKEVSTALSKKSKDFFIEFMKNHQSNKLNKLKP